MKDNKNSGPTAALVTLEVTRAGFVYTNVRCVTCARLVLQWPGDVSITVLARAKTAELWGKGPAVVCKRCGTMNEVVLR